ncbi:hypothetical protein LCM4573_03090 [Rhizobium sp. LCM 4573]|nr:hypothetical protein LCM4573_03090 [Rhizobium sp. LCM 4573]
MVSSLEATFANFDLGYRIPSWRCGSRSADPFGARTTKMGIAFCRFKTLLPGNATLPEPLMNARFW